MWPSPSFPSASLTLYGRTRMSGRQRVRLAMYQARAGLPADAADGCGNCCITRLLVALWGAIQACASLCCRREPRAPFSAPVPVRQGAGGLSSRSASPSPSQLSRQPDPFETRVSPRHRVTEGTPLERTMLFGFDDQSSLKSLKAEESRPPECPICLEVRIRPVRACCLAS